MSRHLRKRFTIENHKGPTGIGEGIVIPHAKVAAVKSPAIAFGKSKEGVDYQSQICNQLIYFEYLQRQKVAPRHLDAFS